MPGTWNVSSPTPSILLLYYSQMIYLGVTGRPVAALWPAVHSVAQYFLVGTW